jgi:hypothetical protein
MKYVGFIAGGLLGCSSPRNGFYEAYLGDAQIFAELKPTIR